MMIKVVVSMVNNYRPSSLESVARF
jgi:hypothetical protein